MREGLALARRVRLLRNTAAAVLIKGLFRLRMKAGGLEILLQPRYGLAREAAAVVRGSLVAGSVACQSLCTVLRQLTRSGVMPVEKTWVGQLLIVLLI